MCLVVSACGSKTGSTAVIPGGGSTPSAGAKPTLSSWSVTPSALWTARLDIGGNLSGTAFLLVFQFSDTTETRCSATMYGNAAGGSYTTTSCAAGSTGMANSTGTAPFATGGPGTYVNSGSTLTLCKSNSSCQDYN